MVTIKSITLKINDCVGCSKEIEGVYLTLRGQRTLENEYGVLCKTNKLDNHGIEDFGSNTTSIFDGNINGKTNTNAQYMLGSCFKVSLKFQEYYHAYFIKCNQGPLNGQLMDGGNLIWAGVGTLKPSSICVTWDSEEALAFTCDFEQQEDNVIHFTMVGCTFKNTFEC